MPAPEPELPYCNACREGGELCDYHLREELAGIRLANADLHKYIGELEQRIAELEQQLRERPYRDGASRIAELERQRDAHIRECREFEQTLGRALGYPRYCDDQKNFPGATDAEGVCVGEHVPATLAVEAARRIAELEHLMRGTWAAHMLLIHHREQPRGDWEYQRVESWLDAAVEAAGIDSAGSSAWPRGRFEQILQEAFNHSEGN